MFYGCISLEELDISKWDTSSLYDTGLMFYETKWEDDPPL